MVGEKFIEGYLLPNILEPFITKKMINISGNDIRKQYPGFSAEPDHYLRNFDDIFLFEIKDVLIKKEVKVSLSFEDIKKELEDKLYLKKTGKPSAILQLVNSVENIVNQKIPFDSPSNKSKIFPILVLTDEIFNTPGINLMLKNWFEEELLKSKIDKKHLNRIKPLTIVTTDCLIQMEGIGSLSSFKNKLTEYHKKHLGGKLKKPGQLVSFKNFMEVKKYFKMDIKKFKEKISSLIFPKN